MFTKKKNEEPAPQQKELPPPRPRQSSLGRMDEQQLGTSSTAQQNFYLALGSGDSPFSQADPTILWQYNIPSLLSKQKTRILQIQFVGAFLKNFSSAQFPSKIGVKIQGISGYNQLTELTDAQGNRSWVTIPQSIVAWAPIKQMNQLKQSTGLKTFNVIYQNAQDGIWDLGMMNVITLKIVDDKGVEIPGPFNNPVDIQMRILHVAL